MTDPELVARLGEETTDVRAAVVGEAPLDCDAMGRIEVPRSAEEGRCRRGELIGQLFDVGQAAMVVDRKMDPVPTRSAVAVAAGSASWGQPST